MNDVKHFHRVAQELKTARRMLETLVQTISDEITATMDEMLPVYYHQCFASLPDELLASILEESGNDPVDMQMVSRRFYHLVSSLPRLWTTIRHRAQGDQWNLALERSCEQILDVDILVDELTPREVQALRPHWHRVGKLMLEACDEHTETMNKHFSSLGTMHRLRQLSLDLCLLDGDEDVHPNAGYTFYEDWHTPNLTELAVTNIIPVPFGGMSLKHLDMRLSDAEDAGDWDVTKLHTLLTSCQALEQMSIEFENAAALIGEFGPVELPLLRYFKLTLARDVVSNNPSFVEFASNVTITNVEEMHIVTTDLAAVDVNPFLVLVLIFSSSTRFPNLTILDISVKTGGWFQWTIFSCLPKLSYYAIEAPGLDIFAGGILSIKTFPPLRTICFRHCHMADLAFFKFLFECLPDELTQGVEDSPGHKIVIQLKGCSHLSRETMEQLGDTFGICVEGQF